MYETKVELAAAVEISPRSLARHMTRDDWPEDVSRWGPWSDADVVSIAEWMERTLQEDRASSEDGTKTAGSVSGGVDWNTAQKKERTLALRDKRKKDRGQLVERELYERSIVGLVNVLLIWADEIERTIPQRVKGMEGDPGAVEEMIRGMCNNFRLRLANEEQIALASVEDVALMKAGRGKGRPAAGTGEE